MEHEHSPHPHVHPEHAHTEDEPKEVVKLKSSIDPVYILPAAILAGAILISASIFYTAKTFISKLDSATFAATQNSAQNLGSGNTQVAPPAAPDSGPVQISTDDDPVLGDKNAPITLIEFSDYECPFCKKLFTETMPEIKKNYIDTGKVKLVYRDYPLPFHDPLATTQAIAANCAREQGGDSVYFNYHDEVFKRTKSNGQGMIKDELYKIAADLKLNDGKFRTCLDSEKYKDEVSKDITAGSSYGVSGTPTLFIGKSSSNGTIQATRIVGAQPYTAFKTIIDQQLK